MTCNNIPRITDVGCYLFINSMYFPITKSVIFSNLNFSDTITSITMHLKNGYMIILSDNSNLPLYTLSNNTQGFIYYQTVNISYATLVNINLYFNNILL